MVAILSRSTERTIPVSSSLKVWSFCDSGVIVSAMAPKLSISLSTPSELSPSAGSENFCDVPDGVADRAGILLDQPLETAEHVVGALGDRADRLDKVLELRALGDDDRHRLARLGGQDGRIGRAAQKLDRDDASQPLRFDPGAGIDAQRGRVIDLDHRIDAARGVVGLKLDSRDLADAQPVEEHAGAPAEARHRAAEDDPHILPAPRQATVEPVDEAEQGREHGKGEQPDKRIVCTRFHCLDASSSLVGPQAGLARSPPK